MVLGTSPSAGLVTSFVLPLLWVWQLVSYGHCVILVRQHRRMLSCLRGLLRSWGSEPLLYHSSWSTISGTLYHLHVHICLVRWRHSLKRNQSSRPLMAVNLRIGSDCLFSARLGAFSRFNPTCVDSRWEMVLSLSFSHWNFFQTSSAGLQLGFLQSRGQFCCFFGFRRSSDCFGFSWDSWR